MVLLRMVKAMIITVIGITVLLIGLVMVVTPGPALVVIPMGLAILGLEFQWARRLLKKIRSYSEIHLINKVKTKKCSPQLIATDSKTLAR